MFHINRVLCPTDFSSQAQAALPLAFSLARDHGATVVLLHVRPLPLPLAGDFGAVVPEAPEPVEPVKARLRECVPPHHKGDIEIRVEDGNAAEEILEVAREQKCDLIVMGTHGRSGVGRILMGSVAEAVLRSSPCPVMTIKPARPASTATDAAPTTDVNDLMTVYTAATAVDAEVVRNALQAEGIGCFREASQQAGFTGILGFPAKINVRAADFERANKIIRNREACCH